VAVHSVAYDPEESDATTAETTIVMERMAQSGASAPVWECQSVVTKSQDFCSERT